MTFFPSIKKAFNKEQGSGLSSSQIRQIRKADRLKVGSIKLFGKDFYYTDNISFLDTFSEIFDKGIYRFTPSSDTGTKLIIDCGANIGLSVLFFARHYPTHKIIAFEPDPFIFDILKRNIKLFELKNIILNKKELWT